MSPLFPSGTLFPSPGARRAAVLFIFYFITARIGLALGATGGFATLVWPPAGIALAFLLRDGPRLWPAVAAGAFLVNFSIGAHPVAALGIAAGNTGEALLGVWLLRRFVDFQPAFGRVRDILFLIFLAAVPGALLAATVGAGSLWLTGAVPPGAFRETWAAWGWGDALGILLFAPPLLTWWSAPGFLARRSLTESATLGGTLALLGLTIFWDPMKVSFPHPSLAYMVFPPLIWAALRFGPRGVTLALLSTTVLAVSGASLGVGPFESGEPMKNLMLCQFFMGVTAVTTLVLAATMSERRRAEATLRQREGELSDFFEHAPLGLHWMGWDGRLLHANRAEAEMLGYARSEYVGRPIADFHVDPAVAEGLLRDLRAGQAVHNRRARLRARDGSWRDVLISANVLWRDGRFVHACTFTRDVTSLVSAETALQRAHDELEARVRRRTEELHNANETLRREVAQRRTAEEILSRREAQLAQAQEVGHIGSWEWDIPRDEVYLSNEMCRIYGMTPTHRPVSRAHLLAFVDPEDAALREATIAKAMREGGVFSVDLRIRLPGGVTRWLQNRGQVIRDARGCPVRLLGTSQDITERKQAEEVVLRLSRELEDRVVERTGQLERANRELQREIADRRRAEETAKNSLREKETLLKEIHHRVKNNLQIVHSLINLQSRRVKDPDTLDCLNDCRDRVRAMALIHEKLYQSKNLDRVDFGQYIRELADQLLHAYRGAAPTVRLRVEAEGAALLLDEAIPCGLLIYELVSNCLKHAFPGGRAGEILISLRRGDSGDYLLRVRDNGVGIPPRIDVRGSESLGLRLVGNLTEQLNGTMEVLREGGAEFRIRFPSQSAEPLKEAVS